MIAFFVLLSGAHDDKERHRYGPSAPQLKMALRA